MHSLFFSSEATMAIGHSIWLFVDLRIVARS